MGSSDSCTMPRFGSPNLSSSSELWERINRRAHSAVLAVLEGEGTETVDTRDGKVVLDVSAVVERVKDRLDDLGVTSSTI